MKLYKLLKAALLAAIIMIPAVAAQAQTPAPTPIAPHSGCLQEALPDPCGLLADLHWAMNNISGNAPHPNWENRVNFGFGPWQNPNGGSENWAVIANAIALWKPATNRPLAQNVQWWHKFLDCQVGGGPSCTFAPNESPGRLKFIKGTELLSDTYDASVTTAVAAVHYWAVANPKNIALADKARKYLRATWAMYTLAAGQTSAPRYDSYSETGQPPLNELCQQAANGTMFYTGPFIAAAGMRSKPASACQDNRGPLLVKALEIPNIQNKREMIEQAAVTAYIRINWPGNSNGDNVYGLTGTERTSLRNHINNASAVTLLTSMLGGVRTSVTYHFIGWNEGGGNQARATVMERNLNTFTSAVYASKYTNSTRKAEFLFPWSNAIRNGITLGYGKLSPNVFNPTEIQASNLDPAINEQPNGFHGTRFVKMNVPTTGKQYHVVLYSDREAECLFCP